MLHLTKSLILFSCFVIFYVSYICLVVLYVVGNFTIPILNSQGSIYETTSFHDVNQQYMTIHVMILSASCKPSTCLMLLGRILL